MQQSQKSFNTLNIAQIFLIFWLFSLFFPIRYVFPTHFSYQTGLFSDFTSISLYLSDILLFTTWIFVLPRGRSFYHVVKPLKWIALWAILVFCLHFNQDWPLSLFFLGKLLEMIVAYGTIVVIFKETNLKTAFLSLFVTLAGIQSLLALDQFFLQHPIGLFKLGEQQLFPNAWGVAKVVVDGTAYIRGYGTFPHPNLLSAFLIASIFIGIYLFNKSQKLWAKAIIGGLILINILGLTVTFSRAAYLAFACGLVIFFGYHFIKKQWTTGQATTVVLILISLMLSFGIFHKFLASRATVSDQA